MLNFLPSKLVGAIAGLLLVVNVLFWITILFIFTLPKILIPWPSLLKVINKILQWIGENWIACNSGWMWLTQKTRWDVQGAENLNHEGWYMVVSNHQSWVDILVMQHLLNRKIPLLKFFIKRELIKVPLMGFAWWALDFPFLYRHSSEYLKQHPEQAGKDFEATRKACEKFATIPTSVMNFLEGTRFTPAKHDKQKSEYKYLLRPKSGGLALALNVLGEKFSSMLDITIVYPDGIPGFGDFLCGRVKRITVRMRTIEIPKTLLQGDYENDQAFRDSMHKWVQKLWREKDKQIQALMKK
ncbi:MAG TPA: acyltransferase [Smithella sp.]|jgi:1-acyl-sn-glycerol-3-phosphate acyltransferase|nr:acyltransferase [Smithella sp.]NMC96241.1 acyltransferase [Deltaproteobacteria bacterium]HOG10434.1 acyltransferase [Smithella sp.]HOO35095.1 acyltransferase [Smithella sp.]HOS14661.1 acyltransferase [Smithella sp.]